MAERGVALVEAAITIPVVLVMIFAAIDLSRMMMSFGAASRALAVAARRVEALSTDSANPMATCALEAGTIFEKAIESEGVSLSQFMNSAPGSPLDWPYPSADGAFMLSLSYFAPGMLPIIGTAGLVKTDRWIPNLPGFDQASYFQNNAMIGLRLEFRPQCMLCEMWGWFDEEPLMKVMVELVPVATLDWSRGCYDPNLSDWIFQHGGNVIELGLS